jgi:uncharacterized membrane protein
LVASVQRDDMPAPDSPPSDSGRDWDRVARWASALGVVIGTLALLVGIATQGPILLVYTLVGVVPLALGLLGLARARWRPETSSVDPLEELKRRYARGELEDDQLERKVEYLLEPADRHGRPRSEREDEPAGSATVTERR